MHARDVIRLRAIHCVIGTVLLPASLGAQQVTVPDSQDLLKAARSAQARFERIRRQHLPKTFRYGGHRCDERVGRFCFWHDGDDSWTPPPEHSSVVEERHQLLDKLDSAAARLPGDRWIAGQRVRYLVESSDLDGALAVATSCLGDPWWCFALEGFVRHAKHDFTGAEKAFDRSLASMSDSGRRRWTDLTLLLEHDARGRYRKADSTESAAIACRFWWLADPLFMVPGNERRSEHYARLVMNEMLEDAATVRRMRWGKDNRELLLRYGWTIGWEQEPASRVSLSAGGRIIGHHRSGGRRFAAPSDYILDPSRTGADGWNLDPTRPHTVYATSYAREFGSIQHQTAVFQRGDSAVVVVGYAKPMVDDSLLSGNFQYALGLSTDPSAAPTLVAVQSGDALAATVPRRATLMSLEALSIADSGAARERYWLDIPRRLAPPSWTAGYALSDLMLLDPTEPPPENLETAIPLAAPAGTARAGEAIGLYWEIYGHDENPSNLSVSLTIEKVDKGFLRKAAEWMGLIGKRTDQMEMEWSDHMLMRRPIVPRALTLTLNRDMQGDYVMTLTVRRDGRHEATRTRALEVLPAKGP